MKGAFSNGILSLTRALGNLSIEGIPTEDDMQAIAEEVVSTSGGGAKYITSGFSAYNGHPAIGFGWTNSNGYVCAMAIGLIADMNGTPYIEGRGNVDGDAATSELFLETRGGAVGKAIVF